MWSVSAQKDCFLPFFLFIYKYKNKMKINFNKLNEKTTFLLHFLFIKYLILTKGLPQELDPFLEKLFETPECKYN
jgi:hypothetical protein